MWAAHRWRAMRRCGGVGRGILLMRRCRLREQWRGMEPRQMRGRQSVRGWLTARWVSIVPALILIFFVASAAVTPHVTQATDDQADPLSPSEGGTPVAIVASAETPT